LPMNFTRRTSSKLTHNAKTEDVSATSSTTKSSTAMDLMLPFRVLVTPLRTFARLAQQPTAKGLVTLAVLIVAFTTAAQYATATRIFLTIDDQPTILIATDFFTSWFTNILASTNLSIILYWLVFAAGLALVGRFFGKKEVKLQSSLVVLAYLLSVLVVLYAVRTITYLALPPITFTIGSWPPVEEAALDEALSLVSQNWGPLPVYQFGSYFALVSFAWLVLLGVVAVKAMRDISWQRASLVSVIVFMITAFVFGLP
jgi:hypothetical protein